MARTDARKAAAERQLDAATIVNIAGFRQETFQDWKQRILMADKLYRGDFTEMFPDESAQQELPHAMNLVQVGIDDLARLVSESTGTVRCTPATDSTKAQEKAHVREQIANTYWEMGRGELLIPQFAQDLAGAGACFAVISTPKGSDYPMFRRVDPRMAYPDVQNGVLQDLVVTQEYKVRIAARLFPDLPFDDYPAEMADTAEVIEYYSKNECIQTVHLKRNGKNVKDAGWVVKRWQPYSDCPPVAFAKLDAFDGAFRGMFDQITGSLQTKNRIIKLMLDYTDQMTYAPLVSKGLLNEDETPGPDAHYRLDPNVQDSQIGRLQPAGSSPQLFALLDHLEREQRGGASYPAARQGEVSQSIASASFVASTQGSLTTAVRNIQRLLGGMRAELNEVCFQLDEKKLNFEKPLIRPVGDKKVYTPKADIASQYHNRVVYGAGAGLDRLNADVRILQHLGAGLISKSTAREQLDYVDDRGDEEDKISREMSDAALMQKFLTEAQWQDIAKVKDLQSKGKSFGEAILMLQKEKQAAQPDQGSLQIPPGAEGAPSADGTPQPAADMQQQQLQKGGVPQTPELQKAPTTSILVGAGRGQ